MNWQTVLNAVLFQVTWFGCVLGAANDSSWWGAVGIAALMLFSSLQNTLRRDLRFVCVLIAVGFALDSIWASTGVLDFGHRATTVELAGSPLLLAPIWITLLWAGVGLTLMHSLSLFVPRPLVGAVLAGGAAVPSYLGGERLGAVVVPDVWSLGVIVVAWALVFGAMFFWARSLSRAELSGSTDSNAGQGSAGQGHAGQGSAGASQ